MEEIKLIGIGIIEESKLIEAIEKIKYGGITSVITKEGKKITIRVEKIPEEAIIRE